MQFCAAVGVPRPYEASQGCSDHSSLTEDDETCDDRLGPHQRWGQRGATIVGFHDIVHPQWGVAQLWNEIKTNNSRGAAPWQWRYHPR